MRLKNGIFLFLGALIWGTAFVAQSLGNNYMGPLTFQAARSVLAVAFLLPIVLVRNHMRRARIAAGDTQVFVPDRQKTLRGGILAGIFLTAASGFQQIGLIGTDVGKSGFLTALYIVLVPVISFLFTRRSSLKIWISVAIAVLGLYCLCINGQFRIAPYDAVLISCAFLFACQITVIDRFCVGTDSIELSLLQFVVCLVLSSVLCFIFEKPSLQGIAAGILPLLYAGILSSGVAYTFQIIGQKGQDPAIASLIMSLESVISALSGWLFLGQTLTNREFLGCVLMFTAIIFAQLPERKKTAARG